MARNESVVQAELEKFMFQAKDILLKNKDFVLKLTEKLKNKKYLLYSDVQEVRNTVQVTPAIIL